jgi:hypothetical protein
VHSTKQGSLTTAQWYKHFNTCYEVARSIGVEFDNVTLLWEYCAGLLNNGAGAPYASLTQAEQDKARKSVGERYLAYILIQNAGNQHDLLQRELQNDFTKGSDRYPENRSQGLMFLDKYLKSKQPAVASEGTAFAQLGKPKPKGGKKATVVAKEEVDDKSGKKKDPYTDMDCFNCGKKGHPARFCPN